MFTSFFSKSQIKKTIILSAIGIVAIILYVVLDLIFKWNQELALFGYIFCLIYLIIGWMGANHIGNDWNRKNKNYSKLPMDVVDKKMCFRSPYIVSGLFLLMISSIFELIITIVD